MIGTVVSRAITSQPKNAGGGSKQASEKQIKFIEGLCVKQKTPPDIISQEVCGKIMSEISGSEANAIIKRLKEK